MGTVTELRREIYSEATAARLLRVAPSTLHYWLEGGRQGGRLHPPVIRPERTGRNAVTWGEFVEAGLLREYRKRHDVSLSELRPVISYLRDHFETPYPLADLRPFVGPGRKLLLEAQELAGIPAGRGLIAVLGRQQLLLPASEAFIERVEWQGDAAVGWRPHDDPASPVRIRPGQRFGLPAVEGIRTEVIWEHLEEDESFEEVADQFRISVGSVRWAHAYETSQRSTTPTAA